MSHANKNANITFSKEPKIPSEGIKKERKKERGIVQIKVSDMYALVDS